MIYHVFMFINNVISINISKQRKQKIKLNLKFFVNIDYSKKGEEKNWENRKKKRN